MTRWSRGVARFEMAAIDPFDQRRDVSLAGVFVGVVPGLVEDHEIARRQERVQALRVRGQDEGVVTAPGDEDRAIDPRERLADLGQFVFVGAQVREGVSVGGRIMGDGEILACGLFGRLRNGVALPRRDLVEALPSS